MGVKQLESYKALKRLGDLRKRSKRDRKVVESSTCTKELQELYKTFL